MVSTVGRRGPDDARGHVVGPGNVIVLVQLGGAVGRIEHQQRVGALLQVGGLDGVGLTGDGWK